MTTLRSFARALALALPLAWASAPALAQDASTVTVFAAASLKEALDEAAGAYEAASGADVTVGYAGSSTLARQIEEGAPADLFVSADLDWMDYLEKAGRLDPASRIVLLGNSLVLVAPADSTAAATIAPGFDLRGLLGEGRLAMANIDAVPAGRYGKAALESLGVFASVADRVVQAENVRAALLLVARGEAPLGIVYATDAAAEPGVRVVGAFPEESHPDILYPAALVAGAGPEARAFLDFLASDQAADLFAKRGFRIPARGS